MNSAEQVTATAAMLQRYFDEEVQGADYEGLRQWLTERLVYLLLHDMERLLSILYRIDVSESKVKAAFAQQDPRKIAPLLAGLILQREWQKAETRLKYKNQNKDYF
jgi:hypothetical protein